MSHKAFFLQVADAINRRDFDHVAAWFTEDFRLHEPGLELPDGYAGARLMLQSFLKLGPTMKVEVLDVIEEGHRAAVRWLFSGEKDGKAAVLPCIAMYRFADGRIAEDWGITSNKGPWP